MKTAEEWRKIFNNHNLDGEITTEDIKLIQDDAIMEACLRVYVPISSKCYGNKAIEDIHSRIYQLTNFK